MAAKLIGITALSLYLLLPSSSLATTYYIDAVAGSDANAGTSRGAAWRTLAKAYGKINDAVIVGDDVILIRPGRYYALDGPTGSSNSAPFRLDGVANQNRGGTAGHPVTASVDTFYSGDVEITGSLPGNWNTSTGKTFSYTAAWIAAATECTGSNAPWTCCTGSRTGCAGVWYSTAPSPNNTAGTGAGVCFQPGADPGDAPTMWEILYAPGTAPAAMPAFTPGRNQCWFRPEYANFCTGSREPYACCTAAGTGAACLGTVRVYAQTATGAAPGAISPAIEFPVSAAVLTLGRVGTIQYLTFSNGNNGRRFFWRWGVTNILNIHNAHHLTFEDFEIGYNSTVRPRCGSGSGVTCAAGTVPVGTRSGSGFPRDTGGPSYLIVQSEGTSDIHHDQTFRRGVILRVQGDEAIHQGAGPLATGTNPASCSSVSDCTQTSLGTAVLCSSSTCYYHDNTTSGSDLLEGLEFTDQPWEVPNGDTSLYGYGYSWPPTGYSAWNAAYATHFSPLGGGGQTPGPWILQGDNNVLRQIYVHGTDGIASFEAGNANGLIHSSPSGNVVEQCTFDGTQMQYAGGNSLLPYCATCKCNAPSNCAGFAANSFVREFIGGWDLDRIGNVWRNNVFRNCSGSCWRAVVRIQGAGRMMAPQFVNNTMQCVGDLSRAGMNNDRFVVDNKWGMTGAKGLIKNNIFVQDNSGTRNIMSIDPDDTATVTIDRNLYGPSNMRWKWGSSAATTTFATWKSNSGQDASSPVPADPVFRGSPLDLHVGAVSPAVNAGATLTGFSNDHDGVTRPQGVAWDIGAYEVLAAELRPPAPALVSVTPVP
jgi:hypothetical protein